jgi:hypothetical protein
VYKSSIGTGLNFVFFDPSTLAFEPTDSGVVEVSSLQYGLTQRPSKLKLGEFDMLLDKQA